MIAIDFETYLISEEAPWPKPVCCSYFDGNSEGLWVGFDEMVENLEQVLSGTIIAHNAVFECAVIWTHFPQLRGLLKTALSEGRVICTKINEQLINILREKPRYRFSLADIVLDRFQEDISECKKSPDAWRLRYNELDGVPLNKWPQEAISYAIEDSIWAYKVNNQQKYKKVDSKLAVEAAFYLNIMGTTGIRVNVERVEQLENEIYSKLEPMFEFCIGKQFFTRLGKERRPKKNLKIIQQYVADKVKKPLITPKGNVRIDGEALLQYYTETEDESFKSLIDIQTYDKVLTAYIKNLKHELIRSQYDTVKTTGRTSSYGSKAYPSVNIQQMPRQVPGVTWDVRNCFIPREGHKIVSIDYSGLELASTAHQLKRTLGYSKMLEALNEGDEPTDLHSRLGARVATMKLKKEVTFKEFVENKKEKPYSEFRQLAKPINLGFPGGIGYDTMRKLLLQSGVRTNFQILETGSHSYPLYKLVKSIKEPNLRVARLNKREYAIAYDELVGMKRELFKLYPELEEFLMDTHNRFLTGATKRMKNEYGEWEDEPMYRYKLYGFERDWCTYTAFCNGYLMQTPSAAGAKRMVCAVIKKYLENEHMIPLAFIHDEILFEVPEHRTDIIDDVAEIMIDSMQEVLGSVRIAVEADMMDYWMKSGGEWSKTYWKNPGNKELYGQ